MLRKGVCERVRRKVLHSTRQDESSAQAFHAPGEKRSNTFLLFPSLISPTASMSSTPDEITLPSPADFHVHLRAAPLTTLLVPHVAQGGARLAYVMPNLSPPLTLPAQTVAYLAHLRSLDSATDYRGTLFLSPALTPAIIVEAKQAGIAGVKSYPRGVTTGSEGGIESYEVYYPVFEEMERQNMVLNLHGEIPSDPEKVSCAAARSYVWVWSSPSPRSEHLRPDGRSSLPHAPGQAARALPQATHRAGARNDARRRRVRQEPG